MPESEQPTQQQLENAYRKALAAYGHRENVTAVDIGYRYKDGRRTDDLAVRVHLKEKLPESVLEAAEVLPEEIDGVPVDVVQAVYHPHVALGLQPAGTRTSRVDPIQPGVSVSHPRVTAGTFGVLVHDGRTGQPCVLSNWHVLVGSMAAVPGDSIVQPGRMDGGRSPRDTVGHLERMILDQDGDAAVATLNDAREVRPEQWETEVLIEQVRAPRIGEILEKSGRTTNVTRGRVDGTGQYFVRYSIGEVGIDGFKIVAVDDGNPNDEEISSGGDSGSIWYGSEDHQGVGLHFAGEQNPEPREEHAVACYLDRVLTRLDVSLVPSPAPAPVEGARPLHEAAPTELETENRLLIETVARLARLLEQRM